MVYVLLELELPRLLAPELALKLILINLFKLYSLQSGFYIQLSMQNNPVVMSCYYLAFSAFGKLRACCYP